MHGFEIVVVVLLLAILAIGAVLLIKHISLHEAIKDVENFIGHNNARLHDHVEAVETSVTDAVDKVGKKVSDLTPKRTTKPTAKK